MARAKKIPGLEADDEFREAAAKVVAVRARELFAEAHDVLDIADIERVHDMRVATRRLRAVLEIFEACFDPAQHREVLRDVKRLTDALGERRDPDVHIDALAAYAAAAAKPDQPGLASLIGRFRDEQSAANLTLAAALERMESTDLRGRITALIEEGTA
jgi:CHAD domain-containing protein